MTDRKTWLVGVSGGPDSMALLTMCMEQGIPAAGAHVNYHHRAEADEEETYVRAFCKEHGIDLYVRNEPFVSDGNFEADARAWRYSFFEKLVNEHGFAGVLIAHHQDDLIETYLMQEEKNIVPEYYGLKEDTMYHTMRVRRPLLGMTKAQLQKYCDERGVRYYIDSTNLSDAYTRNRIRHSVVEHLSDMERQMIVREIAQRNAVRQERTCRVGAMVKHGPVEIAVYRKMEPEDRYALLREMCETGKEEHRMSLEQIRQIDGVILKKNDFIIPVRKGAVVQNHGAFFLGSVPHAFEDRYDSLPDLKQGKGLYYTVEEGSPGVYAVSLHDDDFPVVIRSRKDGDEITMRFGTKKISRFLIDRHIPLYQRIAWPVIENAHGKVIFAAGLGCDIDHYTVKPDVNVLSLFH
ncbi:MAG: tRNA lysidine(34) synthetase TilS [Bulleidia sp.]